MRNRRMLTLAVLAVAIGFAADAQAAGPYGIAVVTLIQDPNVGGVIQDHSFEIRVRLWDNAGIGEVAVGTAGLADFALRDIKGTDLVVEGMEVFGVAPKGAVTKDANTYGAGFTQFNGTTNLGIADATEKPAGIFMAAGLQPVMYGPTPPGTNVPLRDAGVLLGVGTVGSAGAPALPDGISWSGPAPVYDPDTRIATGEYSGSGLLDANTFGAISFTVLPNVAGTRFLTGPMDPNVFKAATVKAVVVQTITGPSATSNGGGVDLLAGGDPALATVRMRVDAGGITLGDNFAGGANVTLQVSKKDTKVTFESRPRDENNYTTPYVFGGDTETSAGFGGLDIRKGTPSDGKGYQVVDIGTALITVVTPDPGQTLINIKGDEYLGIPAMLGDATDGLYSSQVDGSDPTRALIITVNSAGDRVEMMATIPGDLDWNWTVNTDDYNLLGDWWQQSGLLYGYSQADFDGDGDCDTDDYNIFGDTWTQSFVPIVPEPASGAVPEPATMSLLCLGALGLLRRRRGN